MSRIYIKPYAAYEITGKDFGTISSANVRRTVLSPDNKHSVSIIELRDGCLCISNNSQVPFDFSISRNKKVVATVKYPGNQPVLRINSNWLLKSTGIENREIHTNPDLIASHTMNIDIDAHGLGRIDLKVDESGYAACVFSNKELLFVKMNGNHTFPRLEGFLNAEVKKTIDEPAYQKLVGKRFFENWVSIHDWGLK